MKGRGRANMLKEICTGSSQGQTGFPDNFLSDRMRREPHRHRGKTAGAQVRNTILLREHKRHGPRPIGFGQPIGRIGNVLSNIRKLRHIANVDNQGIKSRPFLGSKDFSKRIRIVGIPRKTIYCFCRNSNNLPVL